MLTPALNSYELIQHWRNVQNHIRIPSSKIILFQPQYVALCIYYASIRSSSWRYGLFHWWRRQWCYYGTKFVIKNLEYCICVNTLRQRQNGRHFADDMIKCIFFITAMFKFRWSLFPGVQLTIRTHEIYSATSRTNEHTGSNAHHMIHFL